MSDGHGPGPIVHTHCTHPAERFATVSAKCSDLCGVELNGRHHDGYVPDDLGIGGGDYVEFRWCLDCGVIAGEWPRHPELGEPESDEDREAREKSERDWEE